MLGLYSEPSKLRSNVTIEFDLSQMDGASIIAQRILRSLKTYKNKNYKNLFQITSIESFRNIQENFGKPVYKKNRISHPIKKMILRQIYLRLLYLLILTATEIFLNAQRWNAMIKFELQMVPKTLE